MDVARRAASCRATAIRFLPIGPLEVARALGTRAEAEFSSRRGMPTLPGRFDECEHFRVLAER